MSHRVRDGLLCLSVLIILQVLPCQADPTRSEVSAGLRDASPRASPRTPEGSLESIPLLLSAARSYHEFGGREQEGAYYCSIGAIYFKFGHPEKALAYFHQALSLAKAAGAKSGEASVLNNMAGVYADTGQPVIALEYFERALALRAALGDRSSEASTLDDIGGLYYDTGQPEKALSFYNRALPLQIAAGDKSGEGRTLGDIGNVYSATGQPEKALELFFQALPLVRAGGDRVAEANILNSIGFTYFGAGQSARALEFIKQALPLQRAIGDRGGEASTLNAIGVVYADTGQRAKALNYFEQALAIRKSAQEKSGEASVLYNTGAVCYTSGQAEAALRFFDQALPLQRAGRDRDGEASTLTYRAYVYHHLHRDLDASRDYESALKTVNSIVGSITQNDLKRSTAQYYQWVYDSYISFLMDRANLAAVDDPRTSRALEVSEMARARALRDLLAGNTSQLPSSVLMHPEAAPGTAWASRIQPPSAKPLLAAQSSAMQGTSLRSMAPPLPGMMESLPRLTSTFSASPFKSQEVAGLAKQGPLLSFHLVSDHLVIFVVDAAGHLHAVYTKIVPQDLMGILQRTREALSARDDPAEESAYLTQLYQLLIIPALPWLPRDTGNKPLLTVAPYGPLLEIPFAALRSPDGHYLSESYAIRETPSLTVLRYTRERSRALKDSPMHAVLFANPRMPVKMDALPAAEVEAEQIDSLLSTSQMKPVMKSGAEATEICFRKMAPVATEIHLATHGYVDERQPLYSGVMLGKSDGPEPEYQRDGFLTVAEVFRLKLNCRMVVLSACETGLGQTSADGVFGLQNAFLSAGCASLLSTLWKVDDTATAALMIEFYRKLMADPAHNRARALEEAQISLLRDAATRDPYYWASFVLTGEAS